MEQKHLFCEMITWRRRNIKFLLMPTLYVSAKSLPFCLITRAISRSYNWPCHYNEKGLHSRIVKPNCSTISHSRLGPKISLLRCVFNNGPIYKLTELPMGTCMAMYSGTQLHVYKQVQATCEGKRAICEYSHVLHVYGMAHMWVWKVLIILCVLITTYIWVTFQWSESTCT